MLKRIFLGVFYALFLALALTLSPWALWAQGEEGILEEDLSPIVNTMLLSKESSGSSATLPVSFECVRLSSESFSVPIALLFLVMETERGTVGEYSVNANGTRDLGPMQINSLWLPVLAELGIAEESIRDNGCVNVAVAAWILRGHLLDTGDPLKALARYHSRTPLVARRYLNAALAKASALDVQKAIERANGNK